MGKVQGHTKEEVINYKQGTKGHRGRLGNEKCNGHSKARAVRV
jgi:hypothetical protein